MASKKRNWQDRAAEGLSIVPIKWSRAEKRETLITCYHTRTNLSSLSEDMDLQQAAGCKILFVLSLSTAWSIIAKGTALPQGERGQSTRSSQLSPWEHTEGRRMSCGQ